jgi:hypothetical protein
MSKQDIQYINLRIALFRFIGTEKIIDELKDIITSNEYFSFTNKRKVKFFTYKNPNFTLEYNLKAIKKKYPVEKRIEDDNDEINWINRCVRSEIFNPFADFIMGQFDKFAKHSNEFKLEKNEKIIDDMRTLSTIYQSLTDLDNKKIFIKYIII